MCTCGSFVGVSLPHSHDVVFPADHLAQDQDHRDGGQAHQEEEGVGSLHHIQTLLMTYDLKSHEKNLRPPQQLRTRLYNPLAPHTHTCMTVTAPYVTADQ